MTDGVGFCGADRQIEAERHNWMSQERCPCLIYCAGLPSRALRGNGTGTEVGGLDEWCGRMKLDSGNGRVDRLAEIRQPEKSGPKG